MDRYYLTLRRTLQRPLSVVMSHERLLQDTIRQALTTSYLPRCAYS